MDENCKYFENVYDIKMKEDWDIFGYCNLEKANITKKYCITCKNKPKNTTIDDYFGGGK